MQSYEKEQEKLQRYWQEILSGEESSDNESLFDDVYLSDEYQPSSDNSDSASEYESRAQEQSRKRKRASANTINVRTNSVEQAVQSNSKEQENPSFGDSIDEVIEFVIAQNTIDFEEEILEEGTSVANAMNAAIVWGPVNGDNLHKFTFEDKDSAGFSGYLYENFYNKSPLEFYEYFVDDDILSMMVSRYLILFLPT